MVSRFIILGNQEDQTLNKDKKTVEFLKDIQYLHTTWWKDAAERAGMDLGELERKGYITKKQTAGGSHYEMTEAGVEYINDNPIKEKPTLYEILHDKMKTIFYRGKIIRVFSDDPGQQYYFYYKGERIGCGAFNPEYEGFVKSYVDEKLDYICAIDSSDFPSVVKATLEYRRDRAGKKGKYLILSDRKAGLIREPLYVGGKHSDNGACIEKAKYIMSLMELQHQRDEENVTQKEEA